MTWFAKPNPRKMVTYGQDESNGDLIFAVRVSGLTAKPHSAQDEATALVQQWTHSMRDSEPMAMVKVEPPEDA